MTGILPTPNRFVVAKTHVDEDTPGAITMPQVFRDAGYTTLSNGKIFHFGNDTAARSWSEPAWHSGLSHSTNRDPIAKNDKSSAGRSRIYESPDVPDDAYGDGKTAEKTIADLQRLKASGKPFFLACGFIPPHMPFYAPKKYWDMYARGSITLADSRDRPKNAPKGLKGSDEYRSYGFGEFEDGTDDFHRMMRHGYFASTSYADKLVDDVMGELDRLELTDNTIIVIWGDHGWNLGEHNFWGKHNTLNTSTRPVFLERARLGTADANVQGLGKQTPPSRGGRDAGGSSKPQGVHGQSEIDVRHGSTGFRNRLDTLHFSDARRHAFTGY